MSERTRSPADDFNRRDVLKLGAAAVGAGLAAALPAGAQETRQGLGPAPEALFAAPPIETVRVGFVGTGLQGSGHCRNLLRIPGVQLKALCDIVPEKVERVSQWTVEAGQPKPAAYTRGERDFERMCAEEDLDLVYTATPWEWHVPVAVLAMTNGKHAATEIPAVYRIEDCWQLVEHAEKHGLGPIAACLDINRGDRFDYLEEFEHPLWKQIGGSAREAGHGGMDYLEDYRLITCLREGLPTDMNVYDAAAISAVCELTERSVAAGSRPMQFPDFTRGRWRMWPKLDIVTG